MAVAKEEKATDCEIDHTIAIAMTVAATKLRNLAEAGRNGGQDLGERPEIANDNVTDTAECQG